MSIDIKVPAFPESVADGTLVTWHKKAGDSVKRDEVIADIETDKVVFEVPAQDNGVIDEILEQEGTIVLSGQIIAKMTAGAAANEPEVAATESAPPETSATRSEPAINPSAKKAMAEQGIDAKTITGSGKDGRILKEDVTLKKSPPATPATAPVLLQGERIEKRVPMTRLRAKIAERLLEAQQTAAILTTFNEVNMQPVMEMRTRYKEQFEKVHGARLGFMSFFVMAAVEALKRFPAVNASIEGSDIVYHGFFDIGIAVGSPRGLVVPILRNADQMSMATVESSIADFGQRAKNNSLGLDDITGGTFSITNGGVFGSLLSTPILNPPQSAILGMHKIQQKPMVEEGEIVIRPMMYLALSYDHRIIDGREAVQFLVTIKELIEDPARLLLEV